MQTSLSSPSPNGPDELSPGAREQLAALAELGSGEDGVVIACEPSAEGVLTAIGLAYLARLEPASVRLARNDACQPMLFEQVFNCAVDFALAERVHSGFEQRCARLCPRSRNGRCSGCSGEGVCMRRIAYATASDDPSMPEAVHRYLRLGFEVGPRLHDMSSHEDVAPLDNLARFVSNECERTRQFARFSHMADGSYLAALRPKANVVPFVAGYFRARLGNERWALIDPVHRMAALHNRELVVTQLDEALTQQALAHQDIADDEHYVRSLWKLFFDRVSLGGRSPAERGYDLQTQLMPHRVRRDMPEFDPRNDDPGYAPERYAARQAGFLQEQDVWAID